MAAKALAEQVGVAQACAAFGVARSSYYRHQAEPAPAVAPPATRPKAVRGLSEVERLAVRDTLNSERFADVSPRAAWATLLDDDQVYLCHWRTMYRILGEHGEVQERRNQLQHPAYARPELLATGPRQVWSWDITKLRGPEKWVYYYLYLILDVFSRYVVGWMVAERESEGLAQQLIAETCVKESIEPGQLILHADRGAAMVAKTVAQLLADLGVEPSHSRPHVSDDNPYSEAHFKTMKYMPTFPDRFGGYDHAVVHSREFVGWYNDEHRHSGLAFLTPAMVHTGQAEAVLAKRREVLAAAYAAHPERFVHGPPTVPELPKEVWINRPQPDKTEAQPAAGTRPPGAEPGSRAEAQSLAPPAERTLEAGEHRASIQPLPAGVIQGTTVLQ